MMTDYIKEIVKNYMNYKELTDLETGIVVETDPLKVKIRGLVEPIGENFLLVPVRLKSDLRTNDELAILKAMGGRRYYILDKVV